MGPLDRQPVVGFNPVDQILKIAGCRSCLLENFVVYHGQVAGFRRNEKIARDEGEQRPPAGVEAP